MPRVYVALFFIGLVLAVVSLISCLSAEEGDLRGLPRLAWVFVILFVPLIGSIAYLNLGRPAPVGGTAPHGKPGGGFPDAARPGRVLAPDDDPEFLRGLDKQVAAEDAERLRRWEEDLRRREGELRKRGGSTEDPSSTDG